MNILLIGSGGREHALARGIKACGSRHQIYTLPGNPGTAQLGMNLGGDGENTKTVLTAVNDFNIDLVVIGPEAPLVNGVADALCSAGINVFGPSAKAAAIEGSKAFSKRLMADYGIPTADFTTISNPAEAMAKIESIPYPHVIKTDGLAAGKGAIIVANREEAAEAIDALMVKRQFGAAGDSVIFEEFMTGEEMSLFAVAAGERYTLLPPSQDYKRAFDGDQGLNTGGMGAYAPVVNWTADLELKVRRDVIEPTLAAMATEGASYTGLLYAGLMVKDGAPRVVEFNCRFGDPETQAVVPILDCDLLELLYKASDPRNTKPLPPAAKSGKSAACVVMASKGYPGAADTGYPISGIALASEDPAVHVYHAGTATKPGAIVNSGGRVLSVVGLGDSLPSALEKAYGAAEMIDFQGAFYRRDIGWRGLEAIKQ
jgi:phosphoribosylamine---glycine ligase